MMTVVWYIRIGPPSPLGSNRQESSRQALLDAEGRLEQVVARDDDVAQKKHQEESGLLSTTRSVTVVFCWGARLIVQLRLQSQSSSSSAAAGANGANGADGADGGAGGADGARASSASSAVLQARETERAR